MIQKKNRVRNQPHVGTCLKLLQRLFFEMVMPICGWEGQKSNDNMRLSSEPQIGFHHFKKQPWNNVNQLPTNGGFSNAILFICYVESL